MKQLAAYCRVSTERQKDEQTIEVQETFIKEWAEKNDAAIVRWYRDDGWSGDLLQRPQLDELLEDAGTGLWEGVVFIDRDRVARNVAYQEFIFRELKDKNIGLYCVTSPMPVDDEGNVMQQILAVFAEYERKKTARRMRQGKIHKAKSGKLVGHEAPYGYNYILKTQERDGYFEIDQVEAEIIKMIFHWVADQGYSMRRVVKELYLRKIPSPEGKENWGKSSVARVLNRKDYIGISYYNRREATAPKNPIKVEKYKRVKKSSRKMRPREEWIEIKVPRIIEDDLFEKAKQRMRENFLYGKRNKIYDYLLTGKVICACNAKRVGDGVNGHHYYRCADRIYKYPRPVKCAYEGVNAEILDQMVWNYLVKMFDNPELVYGTYEKWFKKQQNKTNFSDDVALRLQSALNKLEEEERRYLKAYSAGLLEFDRFKNEIDAVKAKRLTLEGKQREAEESAGQVILSKEEIKTVCEDVLNELKCESAADKQTKMRKLILEVIVGERSKALVKGRIPLPNQAQNIQYESKCRNSGTS